MTDIRLASVDGVSTLPVDLADVATAVRGFADALDDGKATAQSAILLSVNDAGMLDLTWFGKPVTTAEAIGLFELAKAKVVAGAWR